MNPLVEDRNPKSYFGKQVLGWINPKKKKPMAYTRMKMNQIARRRAKNKMARRSRRINRLRNG